MSKKNNLIIALYLISFCIFAYLTFHHYSLKLGLDAPSLCQINAQLNCDTAAQSQYAEIFNIPIAVLGLAYSTVFFLIFLLFKLEWTDFSASGKAILKLITAGSALYSIILLSISAINLKVFCPFCIAAYVASFIICFLVWSEFKTISLSKQWPHFLQEKGLLTSLASIFILAWFVSGTISNNYGLSELQKIIPEKIYLWQNSPSQDFNKELGLVKGSTDPNAIVLVEFADFKCPHCKVAAQTFKTFMSTQNKVKMIYKPFPLDGTCNPSIPSKGDGSRCELAGWTLCAEKLLKKGWDVHYWIFEHQENLFKTSDLTESFKQMTTDLNITPTEELKTCSTSVETYDLLKQLSLEGQKAAITGTPTIFLNNKKLEGAQNINILRSALQTLL